MGRPIESYIDRFDRHFIRADPNDCWVWTGDRTYRSGYGRLYERLDDGRYRARGAHVLSLELATGEKPNGRFAIHSCDNPPCVNPSHLRWGTQMENMQDAKLRKRTRNKPFQKGTLRRMPRGEQHANASLTEAFILHIYRLRMRGLTAHQIAAKTRTPWQTIGGIINGTAWSHMLKHPKAPSVAEMKAAGPGQARKLTRKDIPKIRVLLARGDSLKKIADRFGCNATNIFHIKHGLTWADA